MSFPPTLGITSSFIVDYSSSSLVFQELPSLLPLLDQICSTFSIGKMKGYTRIKKDGTTRSKSVDFSDLSFLQHTPRSTPNFCSNPKFTSQEDKPNLSKIAATVHSSIPEDGSEECNGEVFGIILSRKCPIHFAPYGQKLMAEEERVAPKFQTLVKKSISIKRSSSVTEAYSRIHHQSDVAAEDDDKYGTELTSRPRCVKKKGKFFKACRRLFGL